MGVYGLTAYIRENQRHLSTNVTYNAANRTELTFVVDGWSFIYYLFSSISHPWVYGGEYHDYGKTVLKVVDAWLALGIKLHFVFDGSLPEPKIQTRAKRTVDNFVTPALLFFRTSAIARSTPRFLAESFIPPALSYQATIEALAARQESVQVHFADDEADHYAVELAGQLGAYALSNDSDFLVLNCEGYRGFVSFEDLAWIVKSNDTPMTSPGTTDAQSIDFEDLGFQPVRKSKGRRKKSIESEFHAGLVPPDHVAGITFSVFAPSTLATHLNIQLSLLPLLGSLAGNDITNTDGPSKYFFEKRLHPSHRTSRVASVLNTLLNPPKHAKNSSKSIPTSGMDLIHASVEKLLLRPEIVTSGERSELENHIIESILQYAITPNPPVNPPFVCSIHERDLCPLVLLHDLTPPGMSDDQLAERSSVREMYVDAYRKGHFSPNLLNAIGTATFWPIISLEDPDRETCQVSIGRGIRLWIYALLDLAAGIPRPKEDVEQDGHHEDEDELIDVVEEHSEEEDEAEDQSDGDSAGSVGRLHSAIEQASRTESIADGVTTRLEELEESSFAAAESPVVTEYVRRGTRVVGIPVDVPAFSELYLTTSQFSTSNIPSPLPQLLPEHDRLDIFLTALQSRTANLSRYPYPAHLTTVVALRYIVQALASRPNAEERWTKREAICLLACCLSSDGQIASESTADVDHEQSPEIANRHIQLTSQYLSGFSNATYLSEALLLTDCLPSSVLSFSGKRFHSLLAAPRGPSVNANDALKAGWEALQEGLDECWGIERGARGKRERKGQSQKTAAEGSSQRDSPSSVKGKGKGTSKSLFSALADMLPDE